MRNQYFETYRFRWSGPLRRIISISLFGLFSCLCPAQDPAFGLHGLLKLDPESGAANLGFPLGPGIGEEGLRYVPILVGHFSPLVGLAPLSPASGKANLAPALLATTGFTLLPGVLNWPLSPEGRSEALGKNPGPEWSYPDGRTSILGGPVPAGVDADTLRARFGYIAAVGDASLPHPSHASSPVPLVLSGSEGDLLVALSDDLRFPQQVVTGEDAKGASGSWTVPSGLLAIRGQCAYEYSYSELSRGQAHYRLTGIRNEAGEVMTFTYGDNGVDYEARWRTFGVKVALEGTATIPPILALDDAFSPLDPRAPAYTFRKVVALMRIAYEGLEAPWSYTVTALARPEFATAEGVFTGGFQSATGTEEGVLKDSFRRNLQVNSVRKEGTGEFFKLSYGKAQARGDGDQTFAPTVLEEIGQPGRNLKLIWEGRPAPSNASSPGGARRYGVTLVEDRSFLCPDGNMATPQLTALRPGDQGLVLICLPGSATAPDPEAVIQQKRRREYRGGLKGGCPESGDGSSSSAPIPGTITFFPQLHEVTFGGPSLGPGQSGGAGRSREGGIGPGGESFGPGEYARWRQAMLDNPSSSGSFTFGSNAPPLEAGGASIGNSLNAQTQEANRVLRLNGERTAQIAHSVQATHQAQVEKARQETAKQTEQAFADQAAKANIIQAQQQQHFQQQTKDHQRRVQQEHAAQQAHYRQQAEAEADAKAKLERAREASVKEAKAKEAKTKEDHAKVEAKVQAELKEAQERARREAEQASAQRKEQRAREADLRQKAAETWAQEAALESLKIEDAAREQYAAAARREAEARARDEEKAKADLALRLSRTLAEGKASSTIMIPGETPGSRIQRHYGPDGRAMTDIYWDGDHQDPYAFDWDWTRAAPRGPARALTDEEAAKAQPFSLVWDRIKTGTSRPEVEAGIAPVYPYLIASAGSRLIPVKDQTQFSRAAWQELFRDAGAQARKANLWTRGKELTLTATGVNNDGHYMTLPCVGGEAFNGMAEVLTQGLRTGFICLGMSFDTGHGTPCLDWKGAKAFTGTDGETLHQNITGTAPEGANRVVLFLQANKACNPGAEATFKKVTFNKEPDHQKAQAAEREFAESPLHQFLLANPVNEGDLAKQMEEFGSLGGGLANIGQKGAILAYKALKPMLKGTGEEAHHLIEQRFAKIMLEKSRDMLATAVTKGEHQIFTNHWRKLITYGEETKKVTKEWVMEKAKDVYANYPEILKSLGLD